MLNRRDFFKRLVSTGMVLGSTSFDPFSIALNCPTAEAENKGYLPIPVPKVRVIGLGGSGGRAVDHMIQSGFVGVDFIVADKDIRSMNSTPIEQFIFLETNLSEQEVSPNESPPPTFDHDKKKILQALKGSHLVFIIAGLGGETGTFWAPVIAEICSKSDILTVAVITMPLFNEPSQPRRWAEKGMEKLSTLADTVIRVDLDEYDFPLSPETDFRGVYDLGHKTILGAIKGITDLILLPNYIGIDLEDLRSIFSKKGLAAFQVGIAEGKDRAKKAIQIALAGLSDQGITLGDLQSVLVNFTFGPDAVGFEEITEAIELVIKEMDYQGSILWGMREDETIGEESRAMVFAIGGKYQKPVWAKNIFCQVENKKLNIELERLAGEMNCTVRQPRFLFRLYQLSKRRLKELLGIRTINLLQVMKFLLPSELG